MTKVYVASPYTIGDQLENTNVQLDMGTRLIELGFVPFLPLLSHFWHERNPLPYQDWLEYDMQWLESCDCVLRLEGVSPGADKEVEFAKMIGIPVFYDVETLIDYYGRF